MSDSTGKASLAKAARIIVNECADAIFRRVFALKGEAEPDADLESGVLILMLTGLMLRAEQKGIPWTAVQVAAERSCEFIKNQPLTDTVQ